MPNEKHIKITTRTYRSEKDTENTHLQCIERALRFTECSFTEDFINQLELDQINKKIFQTNALLEGNKFITDKCNGLTIAREDKVNGGFLTRLIYHLLEYSNSLTRFIFFVKDIYDPLLLSVVTAFIVYNTKKPPGYTIRRLSVFIGGHLEIESVFKSHPIIKYYENTYDKPLSLDQDGEIINTASVVEFAFGTIKEFNVQTKERGLQYISTNGNDLALVIDDNMIKSELTVIGTKIVGCIGLFLVNEKYDECWVPIYHKNSFFIKMFINSKIAHKFYFIKLFSGCCYNEEYDNEVVQFVETKQIPIDLTAYVASNVMTETSLRYDAKAWSLYETDLIKKGTHKKIIFWFIN